MIERVHKESTMFVMYIILTFVIIILVGGYMMSISTPIGLTHASINANFASKSIMKGGITHTAATVPLPELAGITPYNVTFKDFNSSINIGDKDVNYDYKVRIDGLLTDKNYTTMEYPYSLPIKDINNNTFNPNIGTLESGNIYIIYFDDHFNDYDTEPKYNVENIEVIDEDFGYPKGPFGKKIDFKNVM